MHPDHHGMTIILSRTTYHNNIAGKTLFFRPGEAHVEDLARVDLKPVFFYVLLRNQILLPTIIITFFQTNSLTALFLSK